MHAISGPAISFFRSHQPKPSLAPQYVAYYIVVTLQPMLRCTRQRIEIPLYDSRAPPFLLLLMSL